MNIEYKKIKVSVPHCPVCKEELGGNGSLILPYKCSCGTWYSNWTDPGNYEVKK